MSFPHALAGWGVSMAGICIASVGVLALVALCTVSVTGQQTTAADAHGGPLDIPIKMVNCLA